MTTILQAVGVEAGSTQTIDGFHCRVVTDKVYEGEVRAATCLRTPSAGIRRIKKEMHGTLENLPYHIHMMMKVIQLPTTRDLRRQNPVWNHHFRCACR